MMQWSILALFSMLVLVPLMSYGCRGERVKWQTAAAMTLYNQGNREQAIEHMTKMASDFRNDDATSALYASLLAENGRAKEGLAWCEKGLENQSNSIRLIECKANCEQHLGLPTEALKTSKSIDALTSRSEASSSRRLNNLAYYRALAGDELGQARRDMEGVIREQTKFSGWANGFNLNLMDRTLVCAAIVARKMDRQHETLDWLGEHIDEKAAEEDERGVDLTTTVYERMRGDFPLTESAEKRTTDSLRTRLSESRDGLAFLLLMRALIYQDLGEAQKAEHDRLTMKTLGFDEDKMLSSLPSNPQCFNTLDLAATYLDTYGYVLLKQKSFFKARKNLDVAILASETNLLALDSPLHNNSEEMMFDANERRPLYERIAAVLHYHRYQWYLRTQELVGEERGLELPDMRRIKELGFDPNSRLF